MKSVSPALANELDNAYTLYALPKLTAEWNLNQYYPVVTDNEPSEDTDGYDIEMFPISSIAEPNRPIKGINKARVNEGKVYAGFSSPPTARFYIGSPNDVYKYWTSPTPSDSAGALTGCAPFIVYGTRDPNTQIISYQTVKANKITITFENSWATPEVFTVEVFSGGSWDIVFTEQELLDTEWEKTGKIELYWNGTDWRQNNIPNNTDLVSLSGLLVSVTSLKGGVQIDGSTTQYTKDGSSTLYDTDGKNSHCNLIELSAGRVADLTDDLVSVSDTFDVGEASNLYPVGTITSNSGTMELWNGDNTYSADNSLSPYKGLLEANVKMNLEYVFTLPDGSTEAVQQFVMYTGPWNGQKGDTTSVELTDYSKFFQNTTPLACMWEGLTVPEIIFRLCDSVGFTNYFADQHDSLTNFTIPVFWTDGEKSLWEVFDDLAKGSQTVIYFDETGTLRVKTREAAFDDVIEPAYSLIGAVGDKAGDTKLPNIISVDQTTSFEANTVDVSYQTTRWSDYQNGIPAMQTVWEPDGTVALRSTKLVKAASATDTVIYIDPGDVKYWTPTGLVNIDGEIMKYDALEYVYYTYSGSVATRNVAMVTSQDDKDKYDKLALDGLQYRNTYTGGMRISQRGAWNTTPKAHTVGPSVTYNTVLMWNEGAARYTGSAAAGWVTPLPAESKMQLNTFPASSWGDILKCSTTIPAGLYYNFGTKINFVKTAGYTAQVGGMTINNKNNTKEDGYYIELMPTDNIEAKGLRPKRNEVVVYSRVNGVWYYISGLGAQMAVVEGLDYELDVQLINNGTSHDIKVWVNGQYMVTGHASGASLTAMGGQFGMHVRANTIAKFEYVYGLNSPQPDLPNDFSFLDKKTGGFIGDTWERHWVYDWDNSIQPKTVNSTQALQANGTRFFDDFGPIVHEIREFDVKFSPNPVLHSRVFMTNDFNAVLLDYSGSCAGASFAIANISRINAILNGDDSLSFPGSDTPISQTFSVLGRALVIDEAKKITRKNDQQIRSRGPIDVELTSTWIQSEAMATALADWILKNMAYGNEELSVEMFGNPLIEVTDVIDIYYKAKNFVGQRYFVTGVSTSFENGIQTSLTLRRVNPAATF